MDNRCIPCEEAEFEGECCNDCASLLNYYRSRGYETRALKTLSVVCAAMGRRRSVAVSLSHPRHASPITHLPVTRIADSAKTSRISAYSGLKTATVSSTDAA